jgi:hypothetical protein
MVGSIQDLSRTRIAPVFDVLQHRSAKERDAITACFLGGTTWTLVCKTLNISLASLPRTMRDSAG